MEWSHDPLWIAIGLAGQATFFSRFLVQWVASERAGRSVVPVSFWHLSLVGSLVLLVYCIHRQEPILALGYLPNTFVYLRNLSLLRRAAPASASSSTSSPD
jgi:lipid-A-disaccharide synthase-like uncharacterized protein